MKRPQLDGKERSLGLKILNIYAWTNDPHYTGYYNGFDLKYLSISLLNIIRQINKELYFNIIDFISSDNLRLNKNISDHIKSLDTEECDDIEIKFQKTIDAYQVTNTIFKCNEKNFPGLNHILKMFGNGRYNIYIIKNGNIHKKLYTYLSDKQEKDQETLIIRLFFDLIHDSLVFNEDKKPIGIPFSH